MFLCLQAVSGSHVIGVWHSHIYKLDLQQLCKESISSSSKVKMELQYNSKTIKSLEDAFVDQGTLICIVSNGIKISR